MDPFKIYRYSDMSDAIDTDALQGLVLFVLCVVLYTYRLARALDLKLTKRIII